MNTWIGTSGFQYTEWKGNFYPEDLSTAKMLPYYAERFSTTEINYTFHRIPAPKTIDNWKAQTPEKFRFALKAPQKITHWSKLKDCADTLEYFCKVVSGLGDRLGPVLFQLPPTFKKDADVLSSFLREFPDMRAAFEFRHDSWFDDEIFDLLKSRNISLCIADTDDLATPRKLTADYGYLRLRREDYQKKDVESWSKFVTEQKSNWKDAFVYFKHGRKRHRPEACETNDGFGSVSRTDQPMPLRANFLCRFTLGLSGLVLFVGNISAQKVGDPVGHLPMKKYDDMTGALVTSGTIVALDRPGLRLFMKCDKPFWGPLRTGSDSVVLWPTVVQLAVWVKAAPMTMDGKKARFDDLAVGQRVGVQYIMQWVSYGWVDGLHCFARRVAIVSGPTKIGK